MMLTPVLVDVRHLFSAAQWAALNDFCHTLAPSAHPGYYRITTNPITPGGYWGMDQPIGCMLLNHLLTTAISVVGCPLRPCHAVIRYTEAGGETLPHYDNTEKVPPYSLLMPISISGEGHPFLVKDLNGKRHTFTPDVGQGVLFNATEMEHSRPSLHDPWHIHAILTYAHADDMRRRSWERTLSTTDRDNLAGDGWSVVDNTEWSADVLTHGFVNACEIAELLTLLDDPRTTREQGYILYSGDQKPATDDSLRRSTVARPPNAPVLARVLSRIDKVIDRPELKNLEAHLLIYGVGDFFAEHIDYSSLFPHRVTAVLLLRAADSGGDLTIANHSIDMRPGTLVAFSAHAPHAINIVSSGRRVSLFISYVDR